MNKIKYLSIFDAAAWLAMAALAGGCQKQLPAPPPPQLVVTQKVQLADAGTSASFAGEVRARSESALGFRVGGKIIARLVDVGATVKTGTPLARIDARDLQLNSAAAKSQLAAAQADLTQAQADYTRYHDLFEKKFISAAEIDRRKAALDVARARLDQARSQLNVADNQSGYAQLLADRAGVITAVEADVGQVVAPGQTVVRLARETEKEVQISVPENRLPEIQAAQAIDIALWAAPGKRYAGRVREVSPNADAVTRTYAVRIAVGNADADMRLGMTARVQLKAGGGHAAAVLPLTAIYQQGARTAVWVVDSATQTLTLTPVKVGVFREDTVSIVEGLGEGDTVVTAGVHKLNAGQKVRVASEPAARK